MRVEAAGFGRVARDVVVRGPRSEMDCVFFMVRAAAVKSRQLRLLLLLLQPKHLRGQMMSSLSVPKKVKSHAFENALMVAA